MACAIFSWESLERFCSAFPIRHRTPTFLSSARELGFALTEEQTAEVEQGKDFIQLMNGPFDLDLIYAPDGIEHFEAAWRRRVEVEGFPVCHLDDIISSKAATNRQKNRESLPRLRSFREWWTEHHR